MAGRLGEGVRRAAREMTARMVDDARGRRVRLYDLNGWPWAHLRGEESMNVATYDSIMNSLRHQVTRIERVVGVLAIVIISAFVVIAFAAVLRLQGTPDTMTIGIFSVCVLLMVVLLIGTVKRTEYKVGLKQIEAPFIASAMVLHGYCASCGQNLRGLPTTEDGCTVCPECGSAWRVATGPDDSGI